MLLSTIPAGAFFSAKMTTLGFDKPCAAGYYSRRGFFSTKMATLGFDKPCAAGYYSRRGFFSAKTDILGFHLVDFDGILSVLVLFSPSAHLAKAGTSWGTGGEIFSLNAQLGALYLGGVICACERWRFLLDLICNDCYVNL